MHDIQMRASLILQRWAAHGALFVLGVLGSASQAHALPLPRGQYPYASYGEAFGYGPFPTHAISQDAQGVLWLASDNGLHLFDGRAIKPLSLPPSLPSSLVTRLLPGPSGSMWCLSGAGLLRSDGKSFIGPDFPGLLGKPLSAASSSPSQLWVGTDLGLFRLSSGDRFEADPAFSGKPIHSIWLNSQEDFIIGGLGTLTIGQKGRPVRTLDSAQGLPGEAFTGAAQDHSGRIWFFSRRRLWTLKLEPFSLEEKSADFQNPWFLSLSSDSQGRLWLGASTSMAVLSGDEPPMRERKPESHGVYSIFEDIEGSIWIGSFGLHRILGRGHFRIFGEAQGLNPQAIWGITRDGEGTVWATTIKGLLRGNAETGMFESVPALENKVLTRAFAYTNGALVLGSRGTEIFWYFPKTGELKSYPLPDALPDTRIVQMIAGPDKLLWVASTAGLYRSADAEHPEQFIRIELPNTQQQRTHITDVMADRRGRIWIGTEKGLAVIENGKPRRFTEEDGLTAQSSAFVTERKDGRLCMARGAIKGIRCFFYENGTVRITDNFDRFSGLTSDTIYLLGTDREDRLWVGSARGLDVISGGRVIATYDHRNGLPNDDINGWSMHTDSDGDLWFGTAGGIAHYHEGKDRPYQQPPPPKAVWSEIRLGGIAADPGRPAHVEYAKNTLEARLIVPSFLAGDNTKIYVKLSDVLPEWESLSAPVFRYAGLEPGDYELEARAERPHEPPGPSAIFRFHIDKPFYRTWPFRIAFVVMLLGLGSLIPLAQRRALRKRNAILQALVEERTQELSKAHEKLLELSKWATEEQMAGGFAHEIRNALAGAKMVLSSVFDPEKEGGETLCAENAEKLKTLFLELRPKLEPADRQRLASLLMDINEGEERLDGAIRNADAAVDRALTITKQILSYSKLGAERPVMEIIQPAALVEQLLNVYRNDWKNDGIDAEVHIEADEELCMGRQHFLSIVENIVSNAADALREKSEGERRIYIELKRGDSALTLSVEDTGIGIDPAHLSKLFDPFFSTKPSTGTGLGLGIVRRLCRLYGGEISAESEPGKGTRFSIVLPDNLPKTNTNTDH